MRKFLFTPRTPPQASPLARSVSRRALALGAAALFGAFCTTGWAWTSKPVRVIVPAPAGGTMDVVARVVAEQLASELGQPVVVDNKPGAGGAIAMQALRAAPADGQTLVVTASNVLTEIPHVMKTGFDPLKDVQPVATIVRAVPVLVSAATVPTSDLKELLAYAKARPGQLSFASYSAGTSSHYAGMILNQKAGLDLQHVPFPGSPPALTQLMSGQPLLMFDGIATSLPLITAGRLRVYGVANRQRSTHLPQVPTLAEQGLPELDFSNWVGVVVAAGVPAAQVEKMNTTLLAIARTPKVRERLVGLGFEPSDNRSAAQMAQDLKQDYERNAGIVKAFNIQLNP